MPMNRVEFSFGLAQGIGDEDAVAQALGNLAALELGQKRKETVQWRILRVEQPGRGHHFLLLLRIPAHLFTRSLKSDLVKIMERLQQDSESGLLARYQAAVGAGLKPMRVEVVQEKADYWLDNDWALHWIGDAAGVER